MEKQLIRGNKRQGGIAVRKMALLLLAVIMTFGLMACQSKEKSSFNLQFVKAKENQDQIELILKTAMSNEMMERIDMDQYSSKEKAMTLSLQTAGGKKISATDVESRIEEEITMDANGKKLKSFVITTTMKVTPEIQEKFLKQSTVLVFKNVEIGGKKYEDYSLPLGEDAFSPKFLKPGKYKGELHYTDELGPEGKIEITFVASPDGTSVEDFHVDTFRVKVESTEPYTNEDIQGKKGASAFFKEPFEISYDTSGVSECSDLTLDMILEGEYPVVDGVLEIDNKHFVAEGNIDSQGNVKGVGEYIFLFQGNMKKFGKVEFVAEPQ